jgi:integrase
MHQAFPLAEFYHSFYEPLKLRSRSDNTRRLYETTLRSFAKFLGRVPIMLDLTDDQLNRYLSWFRQLPRQPSSVNKERNNLLAIWRFAARKRYVDQWPDVDPEVEPKRVPQAWTENEVFRLFASIAQEAGLIAGIPAALWWQGLHLVGWDTGERIGAVLGLEWVNVDLAGRWALCAAESRKGKREDKIYRLAEDTCEILRQIRRPFKHVFEWPYCANYIWAKYAKILQRAGLPADRRSKFHRLRRTVASNFEAAGGDATALLGHSRRSITERYLDPRICQQKQAADLLYRPSAAVHVGDQVPAAKKLDLGTDAQFPKHQGGELG